jgi:hypothetical protein
MAGIRLTDRERELIAPLAEHLAEWDGKLMDSSDDELAEIAAAAQAHSTTNCWCFSYDAARIIADFAEREQRRRTPRQRQGSGG